jgi:hypothetical protein
LKEREADNRGRLGEIERVYDEARLGLLDKDQKLIKYVGENDELKLMLERSERNLERLRKKESESEELMNSMKSRLDELELLRQEVAINEARREQLMEEVRDGFMVENDTMKRKYDEQIRRLNINHDLIVKDRHDEISSLKEELTNQQLISDKNKRELEVLRREKEQYLPVFIAENKKVISSKKNIQDKELENCQNQ